MQILPILIFILAIIVVIVTSIFTERARAGREEALLNLGLRLGLEFESKRDPELVAGWGFLTPLSQGDDRYAFNVLRGEYLGQRVIVFDYHYRTGSGKSTRHHYSTFFILIVKEAFPKLTIGPENVLSRIAEAFGYEDIDFESAEFSRAFCVRSPDKKFAYDFCNAGMIEYLLANRDLNIEVQGPALTLSFGSQLTSGAIEFNLERLVEIRKRIPDYLLTGTG